MKCYYDTWDSGAESSPLVQGRELKFDPFALAHHALLVSPLVQGRELKLETLTATQTKFLSPLVQGRELKYKKPRYIRRISKVAPRAGA